MGIAVAAYVCLVRCIIRPVLVKIRQYLMPVLAEKLEKLRRIGPQRLVEPAVALRRADDHAVVLHHALVADHLRAQGLHQHDGIGAHARAVVKVLRHAKYQHIVLFLRPVHIGAAVGAFPAQGRHLGGVAGEDLDLAAARVQHRIHAEELAAHLLFHVHADLVELAAHQVVAAHRHELRPVHHCRHVVAGNAAPMGDAGGAVLVAAGIAAVWVALGVPDHHGDIRLVDVAVHDDGIPLRGCAQIHQLRFILAVVVDDLSAGSELAIERIAQYGPDLRIGIFGVQPVGADQQHILLLYPCAIELLQHQRYADLAMRRGMLAALDPVREHDCALCARESQFRERRHADWVAQAVARRFHDLIRRDIERIRHSLSGYKNLR